MTGHFRRVSNCYVCGHSRLNTDTLGSVFMAENRQYLLVCIYSVAMSKLHLNFEKKIFQTFVDLFLWKPDCLINSFIFLNHFCDLETIHINWKFFFFLLAIIEMIHGTENSVIWKFDHQYPNSLVKVWYSGFTFANLLNQQVGD